MRKLVYCVLQSCVIRATALEPNVVIHFTDAVGLPRDVLGVSSVESTVPPTEQLTVRLPPDLLQFGCGGTLPQVAAREVYVLARGNCTFAEKVTAAAKAGAAAVVIYDSLAGAYWASSANSVMTGNVLNWTVGACSRDCAAGTGVAEASQLATPTAALSGFVGQCGSACPSQLCALTGSASKPDGSRALCCFASDLVAPNAGAVGAVHVSFLAAGDGAALKAAASASPGDGVTLSVADRPTAWMDVGSVLLTLLGVFVTALASFRGGIDTIPSVAADQQPRALTATGLESTINVTLAGAGATVLLASLVLVGLYLLIHLGFPVVFVVIGLWGVGSILAVMDVVFLPLLQRCWPAGGTRGVWENLSCCRQGTSECGASLCQVAALKVPPPTTIFASAAATTIVCVYVALRHERWAWILQDALSTCLCFVALRTLRMQSLRSVAILLCAFFVYDIFMVFITPFLLGGAGIMVDVATAGASTQYDGPDTQECHCRLYPSDTPVCGPGEVMPILMRVPRFQDYRGGYAMLGLGDIIVPGLALALGARRDAQTIRRTGHRGRWTCGYYYYAVALAGYAVGVMCANIAAAGTGAAQPALLYLVPTVLLPLLVAAASRHDLKAWWLGGDPPHDATSYVEASVDGEGNDGAVLLTTLPNDTNVSVVANAA